MSLWGLWFVIGHERLNLLIRGLHWGLTTIGDLIIFLILLKIGWKVSTCVRMTPVKSFLYQSTHSKGYASKFKRSIYVCHWMGQIRLCVKFLAASDTESDCAI